MSRSQDRAWRGLRVGWVLKLAFLAGAAGLAAQALHATVGLPGPAALYAVWLHAAIYLLGICLVVARAVLVRAERMAWLTFAGGIALSLCGWITYWLVVAGKDPAPPPSAADLFWLAGYAVDYCALVLLLRARAVRFRGILWLDGAIAVLALAALSVAVVVTQVVESTGGSTAAVLTNLGYPLGDLVVMGTVVTVFALTGWRPGRSWGVVGVAFAVLTVSDSIFLYQSASGTYAPGTLVDVGAPTAVLLVAASAWIEARRTDAVALIEGWRMLAVPGAFTGVAAAVLVYGSFADVAPMAAILATVTLLVAAVRSVVAFREVMHLSERHERAVDASLHDHLTGLRNHRAFHEALEERLVEGEVAGSPTSLVLIDLVGLKQTNDTIGHQAGDQRLKALAVRLTGVLREGDTAYRVGGDEFAVLLPGVAAWGAFNVAERLQRACAEDAPGFAPSVSVGAAEATPGTTKDVLLAHGDAALVEAKTSHRKTVLYSPGLDRVGDDSQHEADVAHLHRKTLATALARAVDAKDSYTRSHCETVSEICVMVGTVLNLDPEHIAQLRIAGLLHDVGKIGIPDTILQKPAALTDEEFETMKTHSTLGYNIVSGAGLDEEVDWILHHHERPDGRGYPDGLAGDEVPLESRIILVSDAFEAMTSDRPYRPGRSEAEALEELRRHSGTQFDPDCVAALETALAPSRPLSV